MSPSASPTPRATSRPGRRSGSRRSAASWSRTPCPDSPRRALQGFAVPCSRRRTRRTHSAPPTRSGRISPAAAPPTCPGPMPPRELGYDRARLERLRRGAVAVVAEPAVFWVEGPAALACLQGLLTNDLIKPGEHSLVYGALLTPKGAIVVDYWVFREPERFALVAPIEGRLASHELFRRQLPPRLAPLTAPAGQEIGSA